MIAVVCLCAWACAGTRGDCCLLSIGCASYATARVCPCYQPAGLCDTNGSGDEVLAIDDEVLRTIDGSPSPPVHSAVRIQRDPYLLFATGDTLRTFTVAQEDDGRIALPCTPGKDLPVDKLAWPWSRHTDPHEWDPPKHDAPQVTSCRTTDDAAYEQIVVVRQVVQREVRYFMVTTYRD